MHSVRNLVILVFLSLLLLIMGTVGYMVLEEWSLLESLYMTVITVTTVGYGEIRQLDPAGRIFTLVLIFVGVGLVLYSPGP